MRIDIASSRQKGIHLGFPTCLVLNPLGAAFLTRRLRQQGVAITYRQTLKMSRAIKRYRRGNPDWKLVEVQASGGASVEIVI